MRRFCIRTKMINSIHTLTDACIKLVFVQALHVGNSVLVDNVLFTLCTGGSCKHTFKHLFLFIHQSLHKNVKHPIWLVSTAILTENKKIINETLKFIHETKRFE